MPYSLWVGSRDPQNERRRGGSRLGTHITTAARVSSSPVVSWCANRVDAFVLGTDSAQYRKWWKGSAWGPSLTGYEYMGGVISAFREQAPPRAFAA